MRAPTLKHPLILIIQLTISHFFLGGAYRSNGGCQNYEIKPCDSVFGCENMDKGRPTCQKTCDDENLSYRSLF